MQPRTKGRQSIRFIAISDYGICFKWINNKATPSTFQSVARKYLLDYLECGTIWDIAVLYKENSKHRIRDIIYFRIRYNINTQYERRMFIRCIRHMKVKLYRLQPESIQDIINFFSSFPETFEWLYTKDRL